jgi:hypothetical protein
MRGAVGCFYAIKKAAPNPQLFALGAAASILAARKS